MEVNQELQQSYLQVLLIQQATRFRAAVERVIENGKAPDHIKRYPRACCGIISELMGDYLNSLGIGEFNYVCSAKGIASHAWLEVSDLIIDITGDQFHGRPPIYVDNPDAWYAEWDIDAKHLAVHDRSAFFYADERQFMSKVLELMDKPGNAVAG